MEQPVQIGLVFPRSGQQLFVTVPVRAAEQTQSQYSERNALRVNAIVNVRNGKDSDAHA